MIDFAAHAQVKRGNSVQGGSLRRRLRIGLWLRSSLLLVDGEAEQASHGPCIFHDKAILTIRV